MGSSRPPLVPALLLGLSLAVAVSGEVAPSSDYSCAQQAGWGKCGKVWMIGFCSSSCAGELAPPSSNSSCADQVSWGKCSEPWMAGHCGALCDGAAATNATLTFAAGFIQGYLEHSTLLKCGYELQDFEVAVHEIIGGLELMVGCWAGGGGGAQGAVGAAAVATCAQADVSAGWQRIGVGFQVIAQGLETCAEKTWWFKFKHWAFAVVGVVIPEVLLVEGAWRIIVHAENIAEHLEGAWRTCGAQSWFACGENIGDIAAVTAKSLGGAQRGSGTAANANILSGTCFQEPAHYAMFNDSTADACCDRCEGDERCGLWTFRDPAKTSLNAGCALKPSGEAQMRDDPVCTSGYANTTNTTNTVPAPTHGAPPVGTASRDPSSVSTARWLAVGLGGGLAGAVAILLAARHKRDRRRRAAASTSGPVQVADSTAATSSPKLGQVPDGVSAREGEDAHHGNLGRIAAVIVARRE